MPQRRPHRAHARRLCAALLAIGVVAIAPAVADTGDQPTPAARAPVVVWSVRPTPVEGQPERANFNYELRPNEAVTDSVRIRNFGRNPLRLDVYASDARTTDSGALDLLPSGETPRRVGTWIELDRATVDLAPGELVDVPFTLTVPENAESGDQTGGIVSALTSPASGDDPVKVEQRLGNLVQVRVDGPLRPALSVSALDVDYRGTANPFGKGEVLATWTVTNTGNVRMGAQQAVRASGPLGLDGTRVFVDPMPELLPGDAHTSTAVVRGVSPTIRSSVEVELRPLATRAGDEFGAEARIVKRSAGTWSMPWTLLLLLSLLVAAPAGLIYRRPQLMRRDVGGPKNPAGAPKAG